MKNIIFIFLKIFEIGGLIVINTIFAYLIITFLPNIAEFMEKTPRWISILVIIAGVLTYFKDFIKLNKDWTNRIYNFFKNKKL